MWKYILKRIGLAVITAFIILSLTYILIALLPPEKTPGLPQERIAYYDGEVRLGYLYRTEEPIEGLTPVDMVQNDGYVYYYYQVPVMQRYVKWLDNIFHWNWGVSQRILPNISAMEIIGTRIVVSMKINIFAVIFSVPLGIALGILAAMKKNSMLDHTISTSVMILISLPSFVIITFLMLLLCYNNQILPSKWPTPSADASTKAAAYILPVFCLSLGSVCGYCRAVRAELCEVMESEYLLLARTKGLTRRQAIMRHALKNSMVPIFPSILAEFLGLFGGSMILERLYSIPGIGSLFIDSIGAKDYNILFVDMALFTTIGLIAGVFLDISYSLIDPRIRMGER